MTPTPIPVVVSCSSQQPKKTEMTISHIIYLIYHILCFSDPMTQNPPELPTKLMVFAEVLLELGDSPTSVAKHEAPHEATVKVLD